MFQFPISQNQLKGMFSLFSKGDTKWKTINSFFYSKKKFCWGCFCFRKIRPNSNILYNGKSAYKLNYTVHHHDFSNLDHITSDRVKFKHLIEITGQLLPLKHLQLSSQALALLELRQICICLSPKGKFLEDTTKEPSLEAGLQPPVPTSASHTHIDSCLSLVLLKPLAKASFS